MTEFIELSHTIEDGMVTYTGLPGPVISDHMGREESRPHYAEGTTFQIGKIEMVANTGTYIDAPFHRYAEGIDLAGLQMASIANLEGLVIRVDQDMRSIGAELFEGNDLRGKAVLIHTGWDRHWRTAAYFENHPFLTRDASEFLRSGGAALVGIDSLNIDDTSDGSRPAHSILLQAGIPIVEHMCNLDALPGNGFKFFAVPAPVKGMGSFPIRAFAIVD
ncbi:MAG: cyclase family protein [Desulfobacterales bacterium]|jgi:kynurenine formamidase|nr:cyclase family protein [Deltaproteobacteria bacterium]